MIPHTIRPYTPADLPAILDLSVLAWEPVFTAWRAIFGEKLFARLYPDWRAAQRDVVARYCSDAAMQRFVAEVDGAPVGFIVLELNPTTQVGEVQLLAVHPDQQNGGIGTALNRFALEQFRAAGMLHAEVGTGGDEGHAPARRSYEKAGYTALPAVRYYKDLRE